uniref:Uncharacterized protein n=1 Tax=Anguilla anguilla TaxID=7936 RepID=A0A0E9RPA0_ANGAN
MSTLILLYIRNIIRNCSYNLPQFYSSINNSDGDLIQLSL